MDPVIENTDLSPPKSPPILSRGLPVAVVAHVLLAVALAWGVQWKRQPDPSMAAVPLPPVASLPSAPSAPSTATMGAGPAPPLNAAPAPAPVLAPPQVVARNTERAPPPAARMAPAERVAPSFDCAKARSTPERLICADPELSRLDRELGRLHARAAAAAPDLRAFRRASDAEWFRRERECRDRQCLLRWYAQRREALTASLQQEGTAR